MSYTNNHLQPFFARMASIQKKASSALVFFVLLACLLPVQAEQLTALDQKNIRSVVEGQMAAFANDDANKAISYAAPNVRQAVGSAARFMSMVRRDYPMVYRPASSTFLQPESLSGEVLQRVHLTDVPISLSRDTPVKFTNASFISVILPSVLRVINGSRLASIRLSE